MRYFKTGCCGCTLKNSTLAIGGICIISSILAFLTAIYYIKLLPENDLKTLGLFTGDLFLALFSVLLVGGVIQNNKAMIIPWLTSWGIWVALSPFATGVVYSLLISSFFAHTRVQESTTEQLLLISILFLLIVAPSFYLWLIVLSYYMELSIQENEDHYQIPLASVRKNSYSAVDSTAP